MLLASLCDTSKELIKEKTFDMEEAAEIIIYFLKKHQVCRQKKIMRANRRRRLVRDSLSLLVSEIAAMCDCSHAQSWQ